MPSYRNVEIKKFTFRQDVTISLQKSRNCQAFDVPGLDLCGVVATATHYGVLYWSREYRADHDIYIKCILTMAAL